jgi:hypothetical protein
MRVKLARTREFDGRMLANFKHERERMRRFGAEGTERACCRGEGAVNCGRIILGSKEVI